MKYKVFFRGTMEVLKPILINVPRPTERADKEDMVHSRKVYDDRGNERTAAYVPGHNLKGLLRTSSVMAMADIHGATAGDLESTTRTLSLPVFASFHHGGLFGSKTESVEDVIERRGIRHRNALISLFGSMPAKVKGNWRVDDVVFDGNRYGRDHNPVSEEYSARRDPIRKDPSVLEAATPAEIAGLHTYYGEVKAVSAVRTQRKKIQAENQALNKKGDKRTGADMEKIAANRIKISALDAEISRMLSEDGGGSESIARKDRAQGIASGLRPFHEMELSDVDSFEIGFAILTLKHLQNDCRVGAKSNTGHGAVKFSYNITVRPAGSWEEEDAGTIEIKPNGFAIDTKHKVILAAMKAVEAGRKDPNERLALDVIPTEF